MIKTQYHFGNRAVPILATAIHNGHHMPDELLQICGISEAERLMEEDPYTGRIAELCSNFITVYSSRFMVDLNRNPQMCVYQKPEDCWGLNARSMPIPDKVLSELYASHQAWYETLDYYLGEMLNIHPLIIVLDIHSYNHRRMGIGMPPDPQIQNPDIILGRSNMPTEFYPYIAELRSLLEGKLLGSYPIDCREDIKFSGGYLSRYLHHKYPGQILSLSIEFKKIFMDEWTGSLNDEMFGGIIALFYDSLRCWLKDTMKVDCW